MTAAQLTHGSSVEWGTDGTTYTAITEAKTLLVPTTEVEYVDVTSLDSPNGFREFIPGLKDAGEIAIDCSYTGAIYALAKGYENAGTVIYFRTTLTPFAGQTSGDVFTFEGYVTPSLQQSPVGEALMMTLNIRVSGDVNRVAGATS